MQVRCCLLQDRNTRWQPERATSPLLHPAAQISGMRAQRQ